MGEACSDLRGSCTARERTREGRGPGTILIVASGQASRESLATLLSNRELSVLQASDGREALALARREHPDLIISEVLMPTMDGYELVRQLRSDSEVGQTPVIFTTAHYLDRDARALAESCGVKFILSKPCDPETVLRAVDTVLTRTAAPVSVPNETFGREHLRLLTDKLGQTTEELHAVNAKLTALFEIGQQLARERDLDRLFREFARTAREIVGARYCVVARSAPRHEPPIEFFTSGLNAPLSAGPVEGEAAEILRRLTVSPGTHRCREAARGRGIRGLPDGHPTVASLVASAVASSARAYGWVCATEKVGAEGFSEDDERLLGILGGQLGCIYENGRLYADLQARTIDLEEEVAARTRAATALADRARLAMLGADVGAALTRGGRLPDALQDCAAALVRRLDAAFARIWTLDVGGEVLELQASAGMYTHLDGAHGRVPVGALKIGLIAASRRPHLTNDVLSDSLISDPQWARREGMVAFAGYPLIVEGQLVGVMAIFARQPLGEVTLEALGSIADEIALGIARQRVELEVRKNEERFQSLMHNASDLVMVLDERGVIRYASPSYERVFGYRRDEIVGRSSFEPIHPDDLPMVRAAFAPGENDERRSAALEYRQRCRDGTWRVLEGVGINLLDDPSVGGVVVNSWDVTTRQRAEERTAALLSLAQDLAGTLDREHILDHAQRHTAAVLACDAVGIFALDDSGEAVRLIAQWAMSDALLAVAASSELRRGMLGGWAEGGRTAVINTFGELPQAVRALASRAGIGAMIVAPLLAHDLDLGALVAFRVAGGPPFEPDQAELCAGIAKQLAMAMEAVELHREQREEALVAHALARVGKELIGALGKPGLLERLCQVTVDVFQCDMSGTILQRQDGAWVQVASTGWRPEEREVLHALILPPGALATLVTRLEREEVVQISLREVQADWAQGGRRAGMETAICIPLRRNGQVIGVHFVGFRGQTLELTPVQRRIGEGLATLASLALDDALLIRRLDRANRLKSEFVGTMSHELRTPLNIIIGYNDLLRTGDFGPVTSGQTETMDRIDESARSLLRLINATLDVGRLESEDAPIELSDVRLAELFGELRREMRRAEEQSIAIVHWPVLSADLRLRTDRVKLKVILKNLIANALKFTDQGRVDVTVECADGAVAFAVRDTGIGMPPAALATIFEWFRQLEPSMRRSHGGVGLGLYVARRLTEMLGGTIAVESQPGHGSTFRVQIPNARRGRTRHGTGADTADPADGPGSRSRTR